MSLQCGIERNYPSSYYEREEKNPQTLSRNLRCGSCSDCCNAQSETGEVCCAASDINDEYRQPTRLTNHSALVRDAALTFVGESLNAGENRIGIEMRFRDHVGLEAAGAPAIVEVGGEGILVC